jgi:hypothetical protein
LVHQKRVRYGRSVIVNGVLTTGQGAPIGGAHIRILAAPSNGLYRFRQAAMVTTRANGAWSVALPPGPSRIVVAAYGGSARLLPASGQVTVTVPARVLFSLAPAVTSWGSTITLSGHVVGGYIPAAGELVVLRVGWRGGSAEIGHLYTHADGSFRTPYTFLRGNGIVRYWMWATTARESDYPYAPARSRRVSVLVRPG